jgi:hypothetical protein
LQWRPYLYMETTWCSFSKSKLQLNAFIYLWHICIMYFNCFFFTLLLISCLYLHKRLRMLFMLMFVSLKLNLCYSSIWYNMLNNNLNL